MDKLGGKAIENVVDGKRRLLLRDLRVKEHLQQQVTKFPGEFGPVTIVDGFQNFVGFFQRVRLDGVESLFLIPRTAPGGAEALHDGYRFLEAFSRGRGHAATNVNDGEGAKQCVAGASRPRGMSSRRQPHAA